MNVRREHFLCTMRSWAQYPEPHIYKERNVQGHQNANLNGDLKINTLIVVNAVENLPFLKTGDSIYNQVPT